MKRCGIVICMWRKVRMVRWRIIRGLREFMSFVIVLNLEKVFIGLVDYMILMMILCMRLICVMKEL